MGFYAAVPGLATEKKKLMRQHIANKSIVLAQLLCDELISSVKVHRLKRHHLSQTVSPFFLSSTVPSVSFDFNDTLFDLLRPMIYLMVPCWLSVRLYS